MIIDTSALVALLRLESGYDRMNVGLARERGLIPSVVVVEFHRVTSLAGNLPDPVAVELIEGLIANGARVEALTFEDARIATEANVRFGTGNGLGGKLNMTDLMVYAMAKRTGREILCTGQDFAATDAKLHAASRAG